MRKPFVACALATLFTIEAQAEPAFVTTAMEWETGVSVRGADVTYIKKFDVTLLNTGSEPVDLEAGCWRLRDAEGRGYAPDAPVETMMTGTLEPQDSRQAFIVFAGAGPAVHEAKLVRFIASCPED